MTKKKNAAKPEVVRKTIRTEIPVEMSQQIEELVKLGWFPDRQHIIELALRNPPSQGI